MKALSLIASMALVLTYSHTSHAKRTAAEEAAKQAAKAAKASGGSASASTARVRLEFKSEPAEVAGAEVANGPELKVRFESGSKLRLDAEAENFPADTKFTVIVGNINIGTITVVMSATGLLEGELSFRDSNWPAGLPKDIPAGTMVQFLDANGGVVANGPLNPR